jgi:hypothetical protein
MATTKKPKRLNTVNVRLDDPTLDELREIAVDENRTVSNLIQTVLVKWLKERRDAQPKKVMPDSGQH